MNPQAVNPGGDTREKLPICGEVVEAVARLIETARDYERGLHLERRLGATWDELEQAKRELFAALSRANPEEKPNDL